MGKDESQSTLQEVQFQELFREGRLPSGLPFELMPDTVDTALTVAEVDDILPWRKKAKQVAATLKKVGGQLVHDEEGDSGYRFVEKMLDTDVVFASLAWTAQLNGMSIKLSEGVPCPGCAHPFMEVPFGNVKVFARTEEADPGMPSSFPVDGIEDDWLPKTLRGGQLFVSDPKWKTARSNVSERAWDNPEVVSIYRAVSCLFFQKKGAAQPRGVNPKSEGKRMRAKAAQVIHAALDLNIPHFDPKMELVCSSCKETSIVPFDQGL